MAKDAYLEKQLARIRAAFVFDEWKNALETLIADSGAIVPGRMKTIRVVEWNDRAWSSDDFELDGIVSFTHGTTLYEVVDAYLFSIGPFGILVAMETINVSLGVRCVMLLAWDTNTGAIYRVPHVTGGPPVSQYVDLDAAAAIP